MNNENKIDNKLIHSFLILARMLNYEIGYKDLIHNLGMSQEVIEEDIVYVANEYYGLKSKKISLALDDLEKNPLPAIVKLNNNDFIFLAWR